MNKAVHAESKRLPGKAKCGAGTFARMTKKPVEITQWWTLVTCKRCHQLIAKENDND